MLAVLEVTFPVFAIVLCGYFAAARRLLPAHAVDGLNAFVYWFALPAMLFRVVGLKPIRELFDGRFALAFVAAGLTVYAVSYALARRGGFGKGPQGPAQAAALSLNAAHGNIGYLGIALFSQIGPDTLPTVALAVICDNFALIALTLAILESQRRQATQSPIPVRVLRGILLSPFLASIALGLLLSLSGLHLPAVLDKFTGLLAGAAGPCALFAIGAALGGRRSHLDREVTALMVIKLGLSPLVAAFSLGLFLGPSNPAFAIGVVCATLPAASNSFIIAQRYGMNTEAISASILVGTLFAAGTVSAALWAVGLR